ncbi:MAG: hypothetical protein M1815_002486 [Lichina confinis]|nr:MAG: hypothetical protein M1815_002486 [Lichina confinis]
MAMTASLKSHVEQTPYDADPESGYASASSAEVVTSRDGLFSKQYLRFINRQLQLWEPQDILLWSMMSLPSLYQTTAFGLTGLVTVDIISRMPSPVKVDLIFLDTLHHFPETLALVERVRRKYPNVTVHVYKPQGCATADDFSAKHGERLWETNEERYDWWAKVEPANRAYADLHVKAVLTGRRRSQGGKRGDLNIIDVHDAGMIKVNPLANWTFKQVQQYVREHDVPYNDLLDRGYKSVGDWHSTQPVGEGEDERAGRWKGQEKTECGIHDPKSKYARFLREQEQKRKEEALQLGLQQEAILLA